jgi:hypothetical protein
MNDQTAGDLVPLEIAVRCIFSAIYDDAPTLERLTGLAQAVVVLVPVYAGAANGDASPIPERELRDGLVREAGAVMHFRDGRPLLTNLFISAGSVDHAIKLLAGPERQSASSDIASEPRQAAG